MWHITPFELQAPTRGMHTMCWSAAGRSVTPSCSFRSLPWSWGSSRRKRPISMARTTCADDMQLKRTAVPTLHAATAHHPAQTQAQAHGCHAVVLVHGPRQAITHLQLETCKCAARAVAWPLGKRHESVRLRDAMTRQAHKARTNHWCMQQKSKGETERCNLQLRKTPSCHSVITHCVTC
jgi:hypothetical protein